MPLLRPNCAFFVLLSIGLLSTAAADFGTFNVFSEHPLAVWLQNGSLTPVPLHQYYYTDATTARVTMSDRTQFLPNSAVYKTKGKSGPIVFENADALVGAGAKGKRLTLKLNRNCKVVVILNKLGRGPNSTPAVTSPVGYIGEGKVQLLAGQSAFGGQKMIKTGYAVSTFPTKIAGRMEYVLEIPPPSDFEVAGADKTPTRYTILLLDPISGVPEKGFAPPTTPQHILDAPNGGEIAPRTKCPDALHDQWTAVSADTTDSHNFEDEDASGDMIDHTTWHPTIDPVYYCSYMHDHGSYPGRHYKPAYTHTAWHTKDETQIDDRQDESDAGFKTFAIVDMATSLHWIITVHMELGNPRRFSTDFHTIQIAIFEVTDQDIWIPKVELNYKQDYGFAATRVKRAGEDGTDLVALTAADEAIRQSHKDRGIPRRFREFNVRDWSASCDFTLDERDYIDTAPGVQGKGRDVGSNEHWVTNLNTCGSKNFRIDIGRPATGLKSCDTGADSAVDELDGTSVRRVFSSLGGGLEVGAPLCDFDEGEVPSDGVDHPVKFYTDSHFTKVVGGPGKFHLAQWMVPGYTAVLLEGRYKPMNPWNGEYGLGDIGSSFKNIEGWSVLGTEN